MIWVYAIVALALVVVFMPRPKTPEMAKPTEDDVNVPGVEQGKPVRVIFGTPIISAPTCVWWGDFQITPVTKSGGGKK